MYSRGTFGGERLRTVLGENCRSLHTCREDHGCCLSLNLLLLLTQDTGQSLPVWGTKALLRTHSHSALIHIHPTAAHTPWNSFRSHLCSQKWYQMTIGIGYSDRQALGDKRTKELKKILNQIIGKKKIKCLKMKG